VAKRSFATFFYTGSLRREISIARHNRNWHPFTFQFWLGTILRARRIQSGVASMKSIRMVNAAHIL
jgi:hypothetical protein